MSQFNGSSSPLLMPRRRQPAQQMPGQFQPAQPPAPTAPAPKPMLPNQAQQQPVQVQQQPMQPAPGMFRADGTANYSQIALRDNMAKNVQMNTMAAANPATANLPHVKAAIAARNQKNEGLAAQAGYGPNYFQNRDLANSANTRQDAITGATTDQMAADTNRQNITNQALPGYFREQQAGMNIDNQRAALEKFYLPGQFEGQQAQQRAATGKTQAETGQIQAETGQIAQGADQYKTQALRYQKENDDLRKQLDELRTKLAGEGIDPATPQNTAPQGGKPQQQQAQDQQFQKGQQRRHKATGRIETWDGSKWVAG